MYLTGAVVEADPAKSPLTLTKISLYLDSCRTFSYGPPGSVGGCSTGFPLLVWVPDAPVSIDTGQGIVITIRLTFSDATPPPS